MIFEEKADSTIIMKNYKKTFIYFFIDKGEVVYVGQTKKGVQRPFSHRDKIYDEVKLIYCEEKELDFLEDEYIKKYNPKYNKENNRKYNYSINRIRNCLEKELEIKIYATEIKKVIKFLKLKQEIDYFSQKIIVSYNDFLKIREVFKKIVNENKDDLRPTIWYNSRIKDEILRNACGELYGEQEIKN